MLNSQYWDSSFLGQQGEYYNQRGINIGNDTYPIVINTTSYSKIANTIMQRQPIEDFSNKSVVVGNYYVIEFNIAFKNISSSDVVVTNSFWTTRDTLWCKDFFNSPITVTPGSYLNVKYKFKLLKTAEKTFTKTCADFYMYRYKPTADPSNWQYKNTSGVYVQAPYPIIHDCHQLIHGASCLGTLNSDKNGIVLGYSLNSFNPA